MDVSYFLFVVEYQYSFVYIPMRPSNGGLLGLQPLSGGALLHRRCGGIENFVLCWIRYGVCVRAPPRGRGRCGRKAFVLIRRSGCAVWPRKLFILLRSWRCFVFCCKKIPFSSLNAFHGVQGGTWFGCCGCCSWSVFEKCGRQAPSARNFVSSKSGLGCGARGCWRCRSAFHGLTATIGTATCVQIGESQVKLCSSPLCQVNTAMRKEQEGGSTMNVG